MFTSTIMGSNRCHDHFDLFALAQRAPDVLHSRENDEKKKQEIINTYLIIIFRVLTISY